MSEEQENLPGVIRADHSNRGLDFEKELEAAHEWYLLNGWVDIVRNPQGWRYVGPQEAAKSAARSKGSCARDENGRPMIRVRSNVDYSGGNGSQAFCFDAKTTKQKSFPLSSVEYHQVQRLRRSAKCGVTAGLMIRLSTLDRMFFIRAQFLEAKYEQWQRQASRTAVRGTGSISLDELEKEGQEILKNRVNGLWDWYPILKKNSG